MYFNLSRFRISIFLLLAFSSCQIYAQETTDEILNKDFATAQQENKEVLVIFHASWCSWCKKMEKQLDDPKIKKAVDDTFEIAYLTVMESKNNKHLENAGAAAFLKKYGGEKSGISFWLIFNKDRKFLTNSLNDKGDNLGCPYTPEEVAAFAQKLKNHTSLSAEEITQIEQVFVKK